eukprot:SAG11_NODE_42260_length_182_cov_236.228916_1_plen_52_part_10
MAVRNQRDSRQKKERTGSEEEEEEEGKLIFLFFIFDVSNLCDVVGNKLWMEC